MPQELKSAVAIGFKDKMRRKINEEKTDGAKVTYALDLTDGNYEYIWDEQQIKPFFYNPLVEISIDPNRERYETRAIQRIAYALCNIDEDGLCLCDEIKHSAVTLLTGAIIHECFTAKTHNKVPSMRSVRDSLASHNIKYTLNTWLLTAHIKRKTHEVVEAIAKEMLQFAEAQNADGTTLLTTIVAAAVNQLGIWLDCEQNYSKKVKTKSIGEILSDEIPISLFVELPYATYGFYAPLIRLFFVQFIEAQRQYSRYDTDFLCDEAIFPQIEHLARGLDFIDWETSPQYKVCKFLKGAR